MSEIPEFTSEHGVQLTLLKKYGLVTVKISKLDSYYNRNYLVLCHKEKHADKTASRFVVKIVDQNSVSFFDNAQLQHTFMLHLHKNALKCSIPVENVDGNTYVIHETAKSRYLLQVLTFLPGQSVNSAKLSKDEFLQVCHFSGQQLGKLHLAAQSLHVHFETKTPDLSFLPHNALNFLEKINSVTNGKIRQNIVEYLESYKENFLPKLKCLRRGFIHSDFSDCNVIIERTGNGVWEFRGVIDFEHCHLGYLVGGLAVSLAYYMMKAVSIAGCNPIEAAAEQIRGYQTANPLTPVEKDVLLYAIIGRMCSSYISGCHQASIHPENADFIFSQAKHVPKLFGIMNGFQYEEIAKMLFQ